MLTELDKTMVRIRSKRGMSVRVAEACGVQRAAVYQWRQVPHNHVHAVAKLTGWKLETIRPDLFKRRR